MANCKSSVRSSTVDGTNPKVVAGADASGTRYAAAKYVGSSVSGGVTAGVCEGVVSDPHPRPLSQVGRGAEARALQAQQASSRVKLEDGFQVVYLRSDV
jgi:hypothetical protein